VAAFLEPPVRQVQVQVIPDLGDHPPIDALSFGAAGFILGSATGSKKGPR
jgi:hypothetical protein